MTCNHDIAYLVRNACTVRPALGTPARSTHQHVVVMKVFSGNAESQMPETCSINTRITRITRKRECTRTIRWRPVDPCNQHVYTLVRSKYMHAAKHVHGLIPNSLEAKHVNTHGQITLHLPLPPPPKGHFSPYTKNRCKREYVLLEVALHDIAIRKIRFGLPKSGEYESCATQNGLST